MPEVVEKTESCSDSGGCRRAYDSHGDVTVVIVCYNSARHFRALGEAFSASSVRPRRIIVVDNASSDDSVRQARLAGFEVIENGSNVGFGTACNVGLSATTTEFILFCNPDSRPLPTAIEYLCQVLRNEPGAAIVGAAVDEPIRARRFSCLSGNVWGLLPGWLQRCLPFWAHGAPVDLDQAYVPADYATGAFILCRVIALRTVNGFDERFFLYTEEEDLSRRLVSHGWQTLLAPSAKVAHPQSTSSAGSNVATLAPFYFHSLYHYYRIYHSRAYAELARCTLALCLAGDCLYRRLTGQRQVYTLRAAVAPFRSVGALRASLERGK